MATAAGVSTPRSARAAQCTCGDALRSERAGPKAVVKAKRVKPKK